MIVDLAPELRGWLYVGPLFYLHSKMWYEKIKDLHIHPFSIKKNNLEKKLNAWIIPMTWQNRGCLTVFIWFAVLVQNATDVIDKEKGFISHWEVWDKGAVVSEGFCAVSQEEEEKKYIYSLSGACSHESTPTPW